MRLNSARASLLFAVTLLLTSQARAADLKDLVRRSASVDRFRSYQGRKVLTRYLDNGDVSTTTYKVYHLAPDRTLMEGVDGDLKGARLIQIGRDVYLRKPHDYAYRRPPVPIPQDNTDLLLRNYTLRQMRVEQIARRKCVMISLDPRHKGNPTKLVWIDVRTGLTLKTQLRDASGALTEESYFLLLDYNPKLALRHFRVPGPVVGEWPSTEPDFEVLRPKKIPRGYRLVDSPVLRAPSGRILAFLIYSDGLNTLMLIESKTHSNPGSVGGSPSVKGRVGKIHYAICGEHSIAELLRMGKSLPGKQISIQATRR